MAFPKFRMYIDGIYTRLTVDWLLQGPLHFLFDEISAIRTRWMIIYHKLSHILSMISPLLFLALRKTCDKPVFL
jgi:hypothetical protein